MKNRSENSHLAAWSRRPFLLMFSLVGLLVVCSLLLNGCGNEVAAAQANTGLTSATQASTGYPIKVYFSKSPESTQTNFRAVFPVDRVSPTLGVGTYSIQLLIAGPTPEERSAGYFSELNGMFSGVSSCGFAGPDFQLTVNKKGTVTEQGTTTLKFCRQTTSGGIGTDARVQAEIEATLKQFPTITKVVILLQNGHCFGDESGRDLCLQ
jgi:hypothetical protein